VQEHEQPIMHLRRRLEAGSSPPRAPLPPPPALQGLGGNAFWWDTYAEFKAVTTALNSVKLQLKNPLATVSVVRYAR